MIRAIQSAYYQKVMNPLLAETLYSNAPAKSDWKYKHFSADLTSSVIEQELQHEIQLEWGLEVAIPAVKDPVLTRPENPDGMRHPRPG